MQAVTSFTSTLLELRAFALGDERLHDGLGRTHRRHVDHHAAVDRPLGVEQHEVELEAVDRGLALVLDHEGHAAAVLAVFERVQLDLHVFGQRGRERRSSKQGTVGNPHA